MIDIKEAWRATKLLQIGLSEGLLQDHIDQVHAHIVVLVLERVRQLDLSACLNIDLDLSLLTPERRLKDQCLLELRQRVDRLTARHIVTKSCLKSLLLGADNLMDEMGFPELVRFDLQHVLPNRDILAQNQFVLVRQKIDLLHLGTFAWNQGLVVATPSLRSRLTIGRLRRFLSSTCSRSLAHLRFVWETLSLQSCEWILLATCSLAECIFQWQICSRLSTRIVA